MVESDAVEPHLEQLVHGSLPRASAEADDDPVDRAGADDRGNVFDSADDPRIEYRKPDPRRVGIDEPDNLDAEGLPQIRTVRGPALMLAGLVPIEQEPFSRPTCASASRTPRATRRSER